MFIHKGKAGDRIFSHRRPVSMDVDPKDVESICSRYPRLLELKKTRRCFKIGIAPSADVDTWFTLHLDDVEGMGTFTEIRARGSLDRTHTEELLTIAARLGFTLGDVVEGSYLALALGKK